MTRLARRGARAYRPRDDRHPRLAAALAPAPVRRRAAGRGRAGERRGRAGALSRQRACGWARATELLLFDGVSGEWLAEVVEAGRKRVTLVVREPTRAQEAVPDLALAFAPIKKGRVDWLVEKAVELGVARLQPVITQRTIVDKLNLERMRSHIVEAAEQCGRTSLADDRRAGEARRLPARARRGPRLILRRRDRRRAGRGGVRARPGDDPDRPRRRLHARRSRGDPRRCPARPRSASARASCAPRPPRWRR